jgi:serine/threonine protein kinase
MFEDDPEDIIDIIIQRGGNVNIVNSHGETPLHVACTYKHTAIAKSLVQHGASVNAQNDHGETPLHLGARYGPEAIVKVLLQGGGNPAIVGAHGTPLEVATSVAIRKLLTPAPASSAALASSSSSPNAHVPGSSGELNSNAPLTKALSKKYFWLVEYHEISLGQKIGEGGFGTVYRGSWRGIDVAVKFLKNPTELNEDDLSLFLHEISLMARLRHQNILLFVGACLTIPDICFLTEFISHGNMRAVLDKERVAPLKKVNMAIEATRGLTYLHSQNPPVLHRDLKTTNVLVDDNYHIKLADFGLSLYQSHHAHTPRSLDSVPKSLASPPMKRYSAKTASSSIAQSSQSVSSGTVSSAPSADATSSDIHSTEAGKASIEDKGAPEEESIAKTDSQKLPSCSASCDISTPLAGTGIETSPGNALLARALQGYPDLVEQGGTLYTMAPEVLNGGDYTQKSDIYALGIVFWELASEKIPFEGLGPIQMVRAIVEDKLPFVSELGEHFGNLVADMLAIDPKARPTLTEIADRLKVARSQLGEHR